jgi:hypothetical protein
VGFGMEAGLRSTDGILRLALVGVFAQKCAASKRPRHQLSENAASSNWRSGFRSRDATATAR